METMTDFSHLAIKFWVDFKVWGTLGFTILIALIQGIWISRSIPPDDQKERPEGM